MEGDITRLMALYADYTKVPQICPIRSCRYYFPALSQGYDAFYVNWGIDDGIADYLEALQMGFIMQEVFLAAMKTDWQPAILWNIQDTLTEQDLVRWRRLKGAGWILRRI